MVVFDWYVNHLHQIITNICFVVGWITRKGKETGLPPPGPNDILCQALGKLDHLGRVVGQDRLVRPNSYFRQPFDDMKKKIKEEIWEVVWKGMQDAVTRQTMSPPTPYSDIGSNNMRQQLVLQLVVAKKTNV